jgi:hypothetical protein
VPHSRMRPFDHRSGVVRPWMADARLSDGIAVVHRSLRSFPARMPPIGAVHPRGRLRASVPSAVASKRILLIHLGHLPSRSLLVEDDMSTKSDRFAAGLRSPTVGRDRGVMSSFRIHIPKGGCPRRCLPERKCPHCSDRPGLRTMADEGLTVENLTESTCWALLRTTSVGRLAVWVEDHPDIFPLNYAVDHGTVVFRSSAGTKISATLSDSPVALEADGYDAETAKAWSVVIRGNAEEIRAGQDLIDTLDLPLFPWQAGDKGRFVRIVPTTTSGRRFPIADPSIWLTPLSGMKRASME